MHVELKSLNLCTLNVGLHFTTATIRNARQVYASNPFSLLYVTLMAVSSD